MALAAGTLLHDVGKPYGSPHSEIGAGLAVTICRRLGIDEEDIRRVEFLVRQHLVMGQMSQRRDLDDMGMISDFAALCGDEENLHELYLLTFCDLASVAPDAMSSWKETLLGELYTRTLKFLRRGPDLLGAERAEIVERRQKRAAAHSARSRRRTRRSPRCSAASPTATSPRTPPCGSPSTSASSASGAGRRRARWSRFRTSRAWG